MTWLVILLVLIAMPFAYVLLALSGPHRRRWRVYKTQEEKDKEKSLTVALIAMPRWFLWPTKNVTFGCRWLRKMDNPTDFPNEPTCRHEWTHAFQYRDEGTVWVLTHPRERETLAHAQEGQSWPYGVQIS